MTSQFSVFVRAQKIFLIVLWSGFLFSNFMMLGLSFYLTQVPQRDAPVMEIEIVWLLLAIQVGAVFLTFYLRSKVFFSVDTFRRAIQSGQSPSIRVGQFTWDASKLSREQVAYLVSIPKIVVGSIVSLALIEVGSIFGLLVAMMRSRLDEALVFFVISITSMVLIYPRLGPCEERIREATYTQGTVI